MTREPRRSVWPIVAVLVLLPVLYGASLGLMRIEKIIRPLAGLASGGRQSPGPGASTDVVPGG